MFTSGNNCVLFGCNHAAHSVIAAGHRPRACLTRERLLGIGLTTRSCRCRFTTALHYIT